MTGGLPPAYPFEDHPEVARRFPDLHPPFDSHEAFTEANRCLYCFDAPCTAACPTHIDVPRFIKKIATGNLTGSALTILDANVLGASCSRVCPVDVLCEGACVLLRYNKRPIAIGRLQRYAMDHFLAHGGGLPRKAAAKRKEKIACIGAGPASLACAAELAQQGFRVTVIERRTLPGGLNTYGVAEYKLRPPDSLREVKLIEDLGVEFRFGMAIDDTGDLEALEREYDAVFLGIGLGAMHALHVSGADHPDVVDALEFIERYKTAGNLQVGERVVVIGAGNTAIDAANAAIRLGAAHVSILYRRTEREIPAFPFEYAHAKHEGVRFEWLTQPVAIHTDVSTGRIASVECVRLQDDGSAIPTPIPGSNFRMQCDMVIPAIGQSALLSFLKRCRGVEVHYGGVHIDRATGRTTNPKYYAGGDCVNGGREVVDAVADGKRAATAIARFFEASYA
ncbi:MAG: NAD(P)-dependent oxidoreductase [Acidobacteriia bacterium]|nr:NAD(P)-dependent oxidoreductase [Terriglobia bacterium]